MSLESKNGTQSNSVRYTIEKFTPSVREAYANLFADTPDKLAELSWRFEFFGHGKPKFSIARYGDGAIVGMIALMPTLLRGMIGELRGLQAIDGIVTPAARGKFLFVGLGKTIHESDLLDADVVWGFPNPLAARAWFGKSGWRRFGSVPFLIKPLRTGYFLGRLWSPLQRVDIPLSGLPLVRDTTIVTEIDARWDQLWERCRAELGIAVDRSSQWLRWRLDKPSTEYRFAMKVGPDGGEAAVITRIIQKHGATICYVMEALATPEHRPALSKLLKNELQRATQDGADLALAWCPKHAPHRRSYSRAGFFGLADRFRPIQIHFGGRWLSSGLSLGKDLPGEQWYLSYLDSDTV